jgi:hypothetical protein
MGRMMYYAHHQVALYWQSPFPIKGPTTIPMEIIMTLMP